MPAGKRSKKLGNLRDLEPATAEQEALKKRRIKKGMQLAPFYEPEKGPAFEQTGRGTPPSRSMAPEKSVRPKARPKPRPSQALSPREQSERRTELEQYKGMGIPEGSVPATAMPKGNMMLSARERAEMGMKKGRKVKKMMGGGMMKKKGMKKGGKVRGAGIARKGVRPAKMR